MAAGGFRVGKARYAKGKMAMNAPSDGDFSSRAQRLIQGVGGKYSNREKAYIVSPAAAKRARELYRRGYSYSPITGDFTTRGGRVVSRAEVNRIRV